MFKELPFVETTMKTCPYCQFKQISPFLFIKNVQKQQGLVVKI